MFQFARINIANAHTALPLQQLVQLNLNQLTPNQYLAEDTVTIDLRPFQGQTIQLEFLDISHSIQAGEHIASGKMLLMK